MTTREKIIVGVMCLTIAYGAYELIGQSNGKKRLVSAPKTSPMEDLRGFVAEVTQKMVKEKMADEYQHMVERAGTPWVKDPFIPSNAPLNDQPAPQSGRESSTQTSSQGPELSYTGYLQLGDRRLAVINGLEYTTGESIGTRGYYIKSIRPDMVVIGHVRDTETIQLTIEEME